MMTRTEMNMLTERFAEVTGKQNIWEYLKEL